MAEHGETSGGVANHHVHTLHQSSHDYEEVHRNSSLVLRWWPGGFPHAIWVVHYGKYHPQPEWKLDPAKIPDQGLLSEE